MMSPLKYDDHSYSQSPISLTAGMTTCSICGLWISNLRLKEHHDRQHTNSLNYLMVICSKCGKLSNNLKAHKNHMENYHKEYCKEIQQQEGSTSTIVEDHALEDISKQKCIIELVRCLECGVPLQNKTNLKRHIDKMHTKHSEYCPLCKGFYAVGHVVEHIGLKQHDYHKCSLCKKQFRTNSDKVDHIKKDHGCIFCERIFSSKKGMDSHMNNCYKKESKHTENLLEFVK